MKDFRFVFDEEDESSLLFIKVETSEEQDRKIENSLMLSNVLNGVSNIKKFNFNGLEVNLDFNKQGELLSIEVYN